MLLVQIDAICTPGTMLFFDDVFLLGGYPHIHTYTTDISQPNALCIATGKKGWWDHIVGTGHRHSFVLCVLFVYYFSSINWRSQAQAQIQILTYSGTETESAGERRERVHQSLFSEREEREERNTRPCLDARDGAARLGWFPGCSAAFLGAR